MTFNITNAKNANGQLITAEEKTVGVSLNTYWMYSTYIRSGSIMVDLENGTAIARVELNGPIFLWGSSWIMDNIVVTIDGVSVSL